MFTFQDNTPAPVMRAIERLHETGARVRIIYGDRDTGESWNEFHDITGMIGRSTGRIKIPLMVANRRSLGGQGIFSASIIYLQIIGGPVLYKHDRFDSANDWRQDVQDVYHNGQLIAHCETAARAAKTRDFLAGIRSRPW